ncbi:DUF6643 family protein [Streptomyces subrutilus]|uniref:Uncharacterized protein n=1 Tax=Streptomyces subrutilus TaxID=36818 RepID=A0A1E5PMV5_9ACTN|nr:DUF6643 family protein [Streptomyces subrutilus]OEJ30783.1 hypothetical protein BGK67_04990 [Streptomyces subrutilus]
MTSPRSTYGGGYYSAPSFPDTPIYDSLVAERGTPQIAPIRVPAAYESPSAGYSSGGYLPALASSLPALPPAMPQQQAPAYGYPYQQQAAPQPMPLQHAPAPYIPQQQQQPARGAFVPQHQPQQQPRPAAMATGYEAMRPAAPRPMPAPAPVPAAGYEDPYGRPYQGRGY